MLSVIIIAKNEELTLRRCLESVSFAQEIIVLDSGSTDKTVAIAKEFTDKVYETDWQGYGVQKQRALSYASGEWVLNLDADEYLSDSLALKIQEVIGRASKEAWRIPIKMCFYDQPLHHSSSPSRHIRLFKREGARYSEDIVHEKILLPSHYSIGQLKEPILHHSFKDVSHALYKMNKYSSYSAKTRITLGKKPSMTRTLLGSLWMFMRCFILQKGFMDGKPGFLFAVMNAQGTFYRGIKQIYQDREINYLPDVQKQQGEHVE